LVLLAYCIDADNVATVGGDGCLSEERHHQSEGTSDDGSGCLQRDIHWTQKSWVRTQQAEK